jgi:hypothetical protein
MLLGTKVQRLARRLAVTVDVQRLAVAVELLVRIVRHHPPAPIRILSLAQQIAALEHPLQRGQAGVLPLYQRRLGTLVNVA